MKNKLFFVFVLIGVMLFGIVTVASATVTLSWLRQPWLGTDYVYTVSITETPNSFGPNEVVCVQEKHYPDWIYTRAQCAGTVGSAADWVCTIPGPVPAIDPGNSDTTGYNYEFYVQQDGQCDNIGGGNSWIGEQWQETNNPTTITLNSLTASSATPWFGIAGVLMVGLLAGAVIWKKKH